MVDFFFQRKLDDQTDKRPLRKKMKTERFGTNEPNYNDFIDELNKLESANATTKTTSTPTKDTFDNGNGNGARLMKLLLKKIEGIENYLIKLDVKLDHMVSKPSKAGKVTELAYIDMEQLRQFGLPVESESELENLDEKLKTDIDFKTKLVSYFSIFHWVI